MGEAIKAILKYLFECFLIIIYPKNDKCSICGRLEEEEVICNVCKKKLIKVTSPEIREYRQNIYTIYSCVYYTKELKTLIINFKEKREFYTGDFLIGLLIEGMKEWNIKGDVITYVPLSKDKEKKRRFNQCLYLAKGLGKYYFIPTSPLLAKKKNIGEQKKLTKKERFKNVEDAFYTNNIENIKGKKIILIDDIFTTGATVISCARELKKSGAKEVKILTIAKSKL
ncbi:ComF family protein [Clostridium paridis]|uniref:ComF family protein n=1 Tax=Clostridium paridis TaxID=2803863 RepID=A0A937FER6_9CLOT|nr:ComF family protein [Clostridium paridis]MBL4932660.1 ComF family protein [Clostridium paridis]